MADHPKENLGAHLMNTQILRDLQVAYWPIDKVTMYARNARTHSDVQIDQIVASMKEFGWTSPILTDAEGGIIAGHGRYAAARRLGLQKVPVIVLDGLSPTQKRALILADNKLTLNSGWDPDMLAVELKSLVDDQFDIDLIGFDLAELDALFADADLAPGAADENELPDEEALVRCPACGHDFAP